MSSTLGNTIDFDSARLKVTQANAQLTASTQARPQPVSLLDVQQRLMQMLHTTLELDRVLDMFYLELQSLLALDGLAYRHERQDIQIQLGVAALHRCNYRITHKSEYLGELQFSRQKRFNEPQLAQIETLMSNLLYPLRNALMYRDAMRSALNDSLTGTGNRLALDQTIEREVRLSIRHRTPLSVAVVDIDQFKMINDQFGHAYGDEALKAMVNCSRDCLRAVDGLFRFGGEEFVVILNNTDLQTAQTIAERIRRSVAEMQFEIDGQGIGMTVSLGVATRQHDETSRDLLTRCDKLMYQAKQAGRNRVVAR
ncbi:MAG TPA: GGDEF domain-containing protein [Pseudomonas xinjiangensis]|uniref:diguanylate cyclase n=2 Tax=root TaxID=1 RepID=A0A7V1FTL2_9GAMM|nr:GGDEF domain-containing protein [Halopseudomonas xinjiangensis]HEC47868.1 GGDEF domain-containing protein [Halopseudomonas xinjiangensis]